ncbi:S26 family signal peptidase [Vibrio parahaemolyticus]|uniref:S26 family signal peptidase n=1 Tax=Vibrio parahaemolyticus TaxID=670 RepID=UPI00235A1A4A|nr:S26 family signal peptidase [Vibrio parahaemolyticus]
MPTAQRRHAMALERNYIKMGLCPGGFTPVIKKIMAMEGDRVSFEDQVVHINGLEVPSRDGTK